MQLSFRLDKRPGESYLALDGKKICPLLPVCQVPVLPLEWLPGKTAGLVPGEKLIHGVVPAHGSPGPCNGSTPIPDACNGSELGSVQIPTPEVASLASCFHSSASVRPNFDLRFSGVHSSCYCGHAVGHLFYFYAALNCVEHQLLLEHLRVSHNFVGCTPI